MVSNTFEGREAPRGISVGDPVMVTKLLLEGEKARNTEIPATVMSIDYRRQSIGVVYADKSREELEWRSTNWRKV